MESPFKNQMPSIVEAKSININITVIDIEDLHINNRPHPEHDEGIVVYYRFKVDKEYFEKSDFCYTGREILALVGLSPSTHKIFEIGKGQRAIPPDEIVDLRKLGIERFKSVAKEAMDGSYTKDCIANRVEFDLPAEDIHFLENQQFSFETIVESGSGWILIHDFKVPQGYSMHSSTIALQIPASYPAVEIDMMYFYPALERVDGRSISALCSHSLDGLSFQRWSRHRPAGMWRSGIDNLETHVLAVSEWLIDELAR